VERVKGKFIYLFDIILGQVEALLEVKMVEFSGI